MSDLIIGLVVILMLGGLVYFWQKAQLHGLSWPLIILSYIFWPVAAIRGIIWAAKDVYATYTSS